jgi:solute carrier family 35 protein F5
MTSRRDRGDHQLDDVVPSPDQLRSDEQSEKDRFAVGVALLILVVVLWTGSNFLTNFQLTRGYDKPFAVTYLNTSSFTLYLIPFLTVLRRRKRRSRYAGRSGDDVWSKMGFRLPSGSLFSREAYMPLPISSDERTGRAVNIHSHLQGSQNRPSSIDGRRPAVTALQRPSVDVNEVSKPLTMRETAVLALQFMIVWFLANYSLNLALKLTSVASATTLSSASGLFTLAIGTLVGVEIFTFAKLGAVAMSFFGVLLVTQADTISHTRINVRLLTRQPFLGDLLALASALFYALYVVLLKRKIVREERVSMPLFFGFVGLFNVVVMLPVGVILHLTGLEPFELPYGRLMWTGVAVNMAITVVSDFAYLLAMLKSSPLVATVGLSLTIPLAILIDFLLGSHSGGVQAYLGSIVVLSSFALIGLADRKVANSIGHQ